MQLPQDTDPIWIYALAIGTNYQQHQSVQACLAALQNLGRLSISPIIETLPSDGVGENYLNLAVLLYTAQPPAQLMRCVKQIELAMGRIKASADVLIDIDVIAYGPQLSHMTLVSRRLPLADYVVQPLMTVWAGVVDLL